MKIKPCIHCCISAFITPSIIAVLLFNPVGKVLAAEKVAHPETGLFLENPERSYSLNGTWKIQFADDKKFALPNCDDSGWDAIQVPGTWHQHGHEYAGTVWYRRTVRLSKNFSGRDLGIIIPWIADAHELYVNGTFVGGRGIIDPDGIPIKRDTRFYFYHVPSRALHTDPTNIIAFRVGANMSGGGFYFSNFTIGEYETVQTAFYHFLIKKSALAFALFFLGIYHLFLFIGRRNETAYGYFSFFSIVSGIGYMSFNTLGYWLTDSFWFNFLYAHLTASLMVLTLILFIRKNFNFMVRWLVFSSAAYSVIMLIIIVAIPFVFTLYVAYVNYGQYVSRLGEMIFMFISMILILKAIQQKKLGAWIIGVGFGVMMMAIFNDLFIYVNLYEIPETWDYGLLAFIVSIAASLSVKYTHIQNETMRLNVHLEKTNIAFARFVPREFLKFLNRDEIIDVKLGDQVQREMTVLFSDIRSFTTISEKMTPSENFAFLNTLLEKLGPIIRAHNGFIDKYIGDAIMALFPDRADDALDAAIAMQRAVASHNADMAGSGSPPIRIGIGMHTGNLILGTVGEHERMEGTVISDAVNLASRMEGLTKLYGASILTTGDTIRRLSAPGKYHVRILDKVKVKGKGLAVVVVEAFDGDDGKSIDHKIESRELFEIGVGGYQNKNFSEAEDNFRKLLVINPDDSAARLYLHRCEYYLQHGVPLEWDGVESLELKF